MPPPGPYAPGFDAVHYDIAVTLPEAGRYIRGTTTARIAVVEPRRDWLRLDFTGLRANHVRVAVNAGEARPVPVRQHDGALGIPVPTAAEVGDTLRVTIDYDGEPDDGLILRANVHGRLAAFVDNWPDRARFWFPSIDHPSDKATVSYAIRAPRGWQVVANGPRTDAADPTSPPPDGVWRFAVDVPIPTYTMVFGATRFAVGDLDRCAAGGVVPARTDGCVSISVWTYAEDAEHGARAFRRAGEMVAFYADLIAPFPYRKLDHVQAATRFGGMENVGAIFYDERRIARGGDLEGTIAHETAHQWFGDAVTEHVWADLWLSEGFATYFGILFFEHADGTDTFRRRMAGRAAAYFESDVTDLPIVDTTAVPGDNLFGLLNANSYSKGAWVLHMLRGLLGDDAFFDGLRRYYRSHRHGTARTRDLRLALEETAGIDLDWFFQQWVYSPGFPVLGIDRGWDAEAGEALVTIRQTQPARWPTFRFPLVLAFTLGDQTVERAVEIRDRRTMLRIGLPAEPDGLTLDPDDRLLKRVLSSPDAPR